MCVTGQAAPAVTVDAVITDREFLGASVRYGARFGATRALIHTAFRSGDALLDPGAAVKVAIPVRSIRWLAG